MSWRPTTCQVLVLETLQGAEIKALHVPALRTYSVTGRRKYGQKLHWSLPPGLTAFQSMTPASFLVSCFFPSHPPFQVCSILSTSLSLLIQFHVWNAFLPSFAAPHSQIQ